MNRFCCSPSAVFGVHNGPFLLFTITRIPKAAWNSSPADKRIVLFSTTLQLQSLPTWSLTPGATDSAYGPAPYPQWEMANPAAGTIAAAGEYTAAGSFSESFVKGKLGSLESNSLTLSAQDVAISLTPATGSLGPAGAESVKFKAINTFSDGSTNTLVTYSSGESDKVAISSSGTAISGAKAAESYGVVTVKATLKNDARRSTTAKVTLTNFLVSTLTGKGFAAVARFYLPQGVTVDSAGKIYVADTENHAIRKITIVP